MAGAEQASNSVQAFPWSTASMRGPAMAAKLYVLHVIPASHREPFFTGTFILEVNKLNNTKTYHIK